MSVDTHIGRRDLSTYQSVQLDGVELLVSPDLADNASSIAVQLARFLFFKRLKGAVRFSNGWVVGARGVLDAN